MGRKEKVLYVVLGFILILPIVVILTLGIQKPKSVEGIVQSKNYVEMKCRTNMVYDPALNMTLPKEECDPEKWLVVIENKQYRTGKVLYNDIEVGKHYQFTYHPLTGLKIVGG